MDIWSNPKPLSKPERLVDHHRIDSEQDFEKEYSIGDVLGRGCFGIVKETVHVKSSQKFAVKIIIREKAGSATELLIDREIKIMKRVSHKHVVCLEEVYETSKQIFLVMELCSRGSLEELLRTVLCFSEVATLSIVQQLIGAIAYLHDNDIVHRDLKLENILLCEPIENGAENNIKITDFGLSYICGGVGSDFMMQQVCGTPSYMAPEVITNFGYSQQCDIWSTGVIMYTLLMGEPPFKAPSEEKLFEIIKRGTWDETNSKWMKISSAGKQLIKGMLEVNPAHRHTSKEILHNHPWIQGKSTVNGEVTNVLQMMVEYDKEQKKEAELLKCKVRHVQEEDDTASAVQLDQTVPAKSSRTMSPSKPTGANLSQGQKTPRSSRSDRNNNSPRNSSTIPSYMQPTKSSTAAKNTTLKETKFP